jgi:antiviral helicase SKI2
VNIVGNPNTTVGAGETSVYDQQKSTLQNGKSGREGGVSTTLDFLPGGMNNQATSSTALSLENNSLELSSTDHLALSTVVDDSAKEMLAQGGRAPGLDSSMTFEDERTYLTGGRALRRKEETLEATRNPPELLGHFNGAVTDPAFNQQVSAKLRDGHGKNNANRVSNTVAFANIFADVDEEHYLLGGSSEEDSSDDDDNNGRDDDNNGFKDTDKAHTNAAQDASPKTDDTKDLVTSNKDIDDIDDIETLIAESQIRLSTKRDPRKPKRFSWARTDSVPGNFYDHVPRDSMAMQYPFELDEFQKQAVLHLERGEYVFVAAHTSAGKTVVAEYAIALAFKHKTRVIYTSPIKALSNQKFREFLLKFDDVGIITGDVSVNPDATCLVMTTEILRSMLYRGADIVRDIEWVVFDEVHYVNDSERGVVWEEVIIMLPEHVNMIFLSATTPNMVEFSEWIGRTKEKEVFVISTYKRPVPLEHYLYHDKKKYLVMNASGAFLNQGYKKVSALVTGKEEKTKKSDKKKKKPTGRTTQPKQKRQKRNAGKGDWTGLIRHLQTENLLPCVVFSFSKKVCMGSARLLLTEDLTTAREKSNIHVFCQTAIKRLSETDRGLPQVDLVCRLLKKGVGVHTGGLLPIVKEMVEILFGRGLVKILFATETFAMGVNMPARCVVFNGTRKHDGVQFRDLLPGEYTQMSGRAGRRGLDTVGTVLIAAWGDKLPEVTDLHRMLKGRATKLSSQFRLTYTMILILLRVEEMSVEEMIKRSFTEFNTQNLLGSKNLPSLREKICKCLQKLEAKDKNTSSNIEQCTLCGNGCDVHGFDVLLRSETKTNARLCSALGIGQKRTTKQPSSHESVVFPPGRLVSVRCAVPGGKVMLSNSPSIVIKTSGETMTVVALCPEDMIVPKGAEMVVVDGSRMENEESKESKQGTVQSSFMPGTYRRLANADIGGGNVMLIMLEVPYTKIVRISEHKFDVSSVSLSKKNSISTKRCITGLRTSSKNKATKPQVSAFENAVYGSDTALEHIARFLTSFDASGRLPSPPYDIGSSLGLSDMKFVEIVEEMNTVRTCIEVHPCHGCARCTAARQPVERIALLRDKLHHIDHVLSNENLSLFPDFTNKLEVLRHLEYTSSSDAIVQLKGRVACEVNTCDELILTELVFENVLEPLTTEESVALLSAFVFQQRGVDDAPELSSTMIDAKEKLERIATNVCAVQMQHGLELDPIEYVEERLNFGMMHVVYEWARGVPFSSICELTVVEEGTIVRCITRLDETCREVRNIARIIGDPTLYHKMEEASSMIKRDIVFATSLYL